MPLKEHLFWRSCLLSGPRTVKLAGEVSQRQGICSEGSGGDRHRVGLRTQLTQACVRAAEFEVDTVLLYH